jgi:hypothetical protein
MRPYIITELVRTGRIAMVRGSNPNAMTLPEDAPTVQQHS